MELQHKIQPNLFSVKSALVVLRVSFAFYAAKVVFELFRYSLWTKVNNGVPISSRQVFIVEFLEICSWIFQAILLIISAVFFLIWMYRAYTNLGQFQRLKYPENMSVLGWFLPVFNWIGPFLIYSAIVKGYEETLASQNYIRRNTRRQALKNWWWITWITGSVLFAFGFGYEKSSIFCSAMAAVVLMLSNLLLISSLSDMKMMEEGIGNLKNVTQSTRETDDLLDDIL
ncbi:MAG: DUF4328 domain-containing protein [Fluviicola sp.]